jgi:hypothetical protein
LLAVLIIQSLPSDAASNFDFNVFIKSGVIRTLPFWRVVASLGGFDVLVTDYFLNQESLNIMDYRNSFFSDKLQTQDDVILFLGS